MYLKCFCWSGLGLYAILSVADWMLTFALLSAHPGAVESNPLAAACLEQHGWDGLALYKLGGVVVFTAAVVLIIRRRPRVAAGVVALGCSVLLWVTTYSHSLLCDAHREAAERERGEWPSPMGPRLTASDDFGIPQRCWFADERRTRTRTAGTATAARVPE